MINKKFAAAGIAASAALCAAETAVSAVFGNYITLGLGFIFPVLAIYVALGGVYRTEEFPRSRNALVTEFIFIFVFQAAMILNCFKITAEYAVSLTLIISVAYSVIYGMMHCSLAPQSKKYCLPCIFTAVAMAAAETAAFLSVPYERLASASILGITLFDIIPWLIGIKFAVDALACFLASLGGERGE